MQTATPQQLLQAYVVCELPQKLDILYSFIKTHLTVKVIVFVSSCKQVRRLPLQAPNECTTSHPGRGDGDSIGFLGVVARPGRCCLWVLTFARASRAPQSPANHTDTPLSS